MKIGIIGYGYVGRAVAAAYHPDEVMINDPAHASVSIADMTAQCEAVFVCVPTPATDSGACDITILKNVLFSLGNYTGVVICKSTATPAAYAEIEHKFAHLKLAHVPEFLTAANAVDDYLNPVKIVIGCAPELRDSVLRAVYTERINFLLPNVEYCSLAEAAMFKYVANTQLAMKVVINNEYYAVCRALGIDWDNVSAIAKTDPRLGNTHWAVPGPDGSRGFGGACFPKDTAALLSLSRFLGVETTVLAAAVAKNQQLRS